MQSDQDWRITGECNCSDLLGAADHRLPRVLDEVAETVGPPGDIGRTQSLPADAGDASFHRDIDLPGIQLARG